MKIIFPKFPAFRLLNSPWTWVKITIIALLLAFGISAWPTAQCALGACGVKDAWCNGDCSQVCGPTNGLGAIVDDPSGALGAPGGVACAPNVIGGYCVEHWKPNLVGVRCTNAADCNVTQIVSPLTEPNGSAFSDRLYMSGGNSYWRVGSCTYNAVSKTCGWSRLSNAEKVTCCAAGGVSTCTPTYAPPSVSLSGYSPMNPLVYGQDPDKLGMDVTVSVSGGNKTNSCADGPSQRTVTSITINGVSLSSASIDWITGPLALRYPGAYIKGSYPIYPAATITGIGSTSAQAVFHIDPYDPGFYDISVTAIQDDGQTTTVVLSVPAYLLDTTITLPVQP